VRALGRAVFVLQHPPFAALAPQRALGPHPPKQRAPILVACDRTEAV
jgi:hypothetical protein